MSRCRGFAITKVNAHASQFDALKYTLKKMENTLYELSLTGASIAAKSKRKSLHTLQLSPLHLTADVHPDVTVTSVIVITYNLYL